MRVWRISNHATLDGAGGLRAAGRWHPRGRRVVYCAPNPATSLLEVLVHLEVDLEDVPLNYRYFEIDIPEEVSLEVLDARSLSSNWKADSESTRELGAEWLNSGRSSVLYVPCAIVPATLNILLNPLHPDSRRITIRQVHNQEIDPRLLSR